MRERYIPAFIMLLAGAIASILCIVKSYDVMFSLKVLIVVLLIFYIMGLITQKIIHKFFIEPQNKKEKELEEEKKDEETEQEHSEAQN